MLQGLVLLHPGSAHMSGHKVMVRVDTEQYRDQQVAVLAGGGSGQRQPPALVAPRQTSALSPIRVLLFHPGNSDNDFYGNAIGKIAAYRFARSTPWKQMS